MPPVIPLVASGLALILGSAVQTASGYGYGAVALPVLDLAFPSHMPALLILLAPPQIALMVGADGRHVDVPAVAQVSSGVVLGAVAAAFGVLDVLSGRSLRLLFGFATLAALAGMTLLRGGVDRTPARSFAAGLAAGFMGTAAGVPGPPLAVVFAREHGPSVRGTLGVIYAAGSAVSIGALLLAGRVDGADLRLAAILIAPVVVGFAAGRLVLRRVSARFLRAVVLMVVAASAAVLFIGAV